MERLIGVELNDFYEELNECVAVILKKVPTWFQKNVQKQIRRDITQMIYHDFCDAVHRHQTEQWCSSGFDEIYIPLFMNARAFEGYMFVLRVRDAWLGATKHFGWKIPTKLAQAKNSSATKNSWLKKTELVFSTSFVKPGKRKRENTTDDLLFHIDTLELGSEELTKMGTKVCFGEFM